MWYNKDVKGCSISQKVPRPPAMAVFRIIETERRTTMKISISRIASIICGVLSAVGIAYVGLAQIWTLPMADQIQQTIGVIVSFISACLAVVTGKKMSDERRTNG